VSSAAVRSATGSRGSVPSSAMTAANKAASRQLSSGPLGDRQRRGHASGAGVYDAKGQKGLATPIVTVVDVPRPGRSVAAQAPCLPGVRLHHVSARRLGAGEPGAGEMGAGRAVRQLRRVRGQRGGPQLASFTRRFVRFNRLGHSGVTWGATKNELLAWRFESDSPLRIPE
jgi:hypothetical protein